MNNIQSQIKESKLIKFEQNYNTPNPPCNIEKIKEFISDI